MRKATIAALAIVIASFAIAVYLWPLLPERMASHWNAAGEVDGYMAKSLGLLLMPLISTGLLLLFLVIPKIDPLRNNIQKFRKYFDGFLVLILTFLLYIYVLTLVWGLGYRFNMTLMMLPALGVLFYYCGVLIENAKMNWFVGIRTPWTLSSEQVWKKTHRIGGKLFKLCGVIAVVGVLLGSYAFWFVLGPILISTVFLIVYSYFEYAKEEKRKAK